MSIKEFIVFKSCSGLIEQAVRFEALVEGHSNLKLDLSKEVCELQYPFDRPRGLSQLLRRIRTIEPDEILILSEVEILRLEALVPYSCMDNRPRFVGIRLRRLIIDLEDRNPLFFESSDPIFKFIESLFDVVNEGINWRMIFVLAWIRNGD